MFKLTFIGATLFVASHNSTMEDAGHYAFVGPITKFLAEGSKPGVASGGLRLTFKVDKTGKVISDAIELKEPYWSGPITIKLEGARFDAGHLTGAIKVHNGSGTALEGLRFEATDGKEEFKGSSGPVMIRPAAITLQDALLLGDLPAGADSDPQPFDVGGIVFSGDGRVMNVNMNISRLSFVGLANLGPMARYQIDTDSKGLIYVTGGDRVVRLNGDGTNATDIVKRDDIHGVGIDRTSGDILICSGDSTIVRYASDGGFKSSLTVDRDKIDPPTKGIRVDLTGRVYSGAGGKFIQCIEDGKKIWTGGADSDGLFDVDAKQNMFQVTYDGVTAYDKNGSEFGHFGAGPDWHLGRTLNPVSCRIDRVGQVYVLESGKTEEDGAGKEYPRISVFDSHGHIVRLFGRGGKAPAPEGKAPPFQVMGADDIAFGAKGRVYLLGNHGGDDTCLYMFDPF